MLRLINLLFSPEDNAGGGAAPIEDKALNQADLEELLKDDETETEEEPEVIDLKPKKEPKDDKSESDEIDEDTDEDTETSEEDTEKSLEDELEEELKEPTEEELEALVTPVRRKEILTKYPNLFKEFPYLEKAYYREQKYTEIYPTIQEAEVASEKAQTWDRFEGELTEGNLKNILDSLAQQDKNAFHKVADTILDTIKEIDEPTAIHIYSGIAKEIISMMTSAGNTQGQEGLKTAAYLVHQFLFGAREWEPHQPLHKAVTKDPRIDEVNTRERQLLQRQFAAARDEIGSKVNNSIKATIERNIDPKDSMSTYVKSKAIDDVLEDVQSQMTTDKRFQKIMTRLWQQAVQKDFNEDSKQAIRSAVLSKARQLLLPAIQKGRKTALGSGARKTSSEVVRPEKSGPSDKKPGKSTSPMNSGKSDKERARAIPANVSTKDFLMSD